MKEFGKWLGGLLVFACSMLLLIATFKSCDNDTPLMYEIGKISKMITDEFDRGYHSQDTTRHK